MVKSLRGRTMKFLVFATILTLFATRMAWARIQGFLDSHAPQPLVNVRRDLVGGQCVTTVDILDNGRGRQQRGSATIDVFPDSISLRVNPDESVPRFSRMETTRQLATDRDANRVDGSMTRIVLTHTNVSDCRRRINTTGKNEPPVPRPLTIRLSGVVEGGGMRSLCVETNDQSTPVVDGPYDIVDNSADRRLRPAPSNQSIRRDWIQPGRCVNRTPESEIVMTLTPINASH